MDEYGEEEMVENPTLRAAYNLEPLHQNQPLRWDYKAELIGEKIYDKIIHLCEVCELPILVYGRMLPCKHIFCFDCARKCDKSCRRCSSKVQKVEKSALGTVYVCTHGAPKHSTKGCRRTYLSQRDLQSHIAHRHLPKASTASSKPQPTSASSQPIPNQLPLTQQQAAQQAAQKPAAPSPHPSPSHLHALPSLIPPVSAHNQTSGVSVTSGPPLIPGLGDIRPQAPVSPALMNQSPSLVPGLSMGYSNSAQPNSDMYPSVEMTTNMGQQQLMPHGHPQQMQQQQQLQQQQLQHQQHQQFQQQQHMQQQQQHMQQQQQMHQQQQQQMHQQQQHMQQQLQQQQLQQHQQQQMQQQHHHHQGMGLQGGHVAGKLQPYGQQFPVSSPLMQQGSAPIQSGPPISHPHASMAASQPGEAYSKPQTMATAGHTSQSRTNLNLITVPIQDEGQYRPLPYVNPSMAASQANSPSFPGGQVRPNHSAASQVYTQASMSPALSSFPTSHSQNMMTPGSTNAQNMSFNPAVAGGLGGNNPQMAAGSAGMMVNQRAGLPGTLHPARALAGLVRAAMSMGAVRAPGGGLMPTPGGGQPMGARFPPAARWAAPRQGQPRPRAEGQFNPGNFYN